MTKRWADNRDYIIRLYKTEDLTLKQVRERLLRERNFVAGIRSYRTYLSKWGVRKYKKRPKDHFHHYRRHHDHDRDGQYPASVGGSRPPLPQPSPSDTWSAGSSSSYPPRTGRGQGGLPPFIDVVPPPDTTRQSAGFYDGGSTRHLTIPSPMPHHRRSLPYPDTLDLSFPSPPSWRDTDRSPSISGSSDMSSNPAFDHPQPATRPFDQNLLPVPPLHLPPIHGGRPVTPESGLSDAYQGRGLPAPQSWALWPAADKEY